MRFTKEALQALRSGAEAYLLEILEKANLACGHAGRCTLKDKDIRFVRRVLDHDISMGCTEASIQAWQKDLLKERAKRITYKEAQTKEACRRQKLRGTSTDEEGRLQAKCPAQEINIFVYFLADSPPCIVIMIPPVF